MYILYQNKDIPASYVTGDSMNPHLCGHDTFVNIASWPHLLFAFNPHIPENSKSAKHDNKLSLVITVHPDCHQMQV